MLDVLMQRADYCYGYIAEVHNSAELWIALTQYTLINISLPTLNDKIAGSYRHCFFKMHMCYLRQILI